VAGGRVALVLVLMVELGLGWLARVLLWLAQQLGEELWRLGAMAAKQAN